VFEGKGLSVNINDLLFARNKDSKDSKESKDSKGRMDRSSSVLETAQSPQVISHQPLKHCKRESDKKESNFDRLDKDIKEKE